MAPKDTRPPALLVKGVRSYRDTVRAIKDHMDPAEFGKNAHFVRSRKDDLIIRFDANEEFESELIRVLEKLASLGPEVIRNVVSLGTLEKMLILDLDHSISEDEIQTTIRAAVPEKFRGTVRIS